MQERCLSLPQFCLGGHEGQGLSLWDPEGQSSAVRAQMVKQHPPKKGGQNLPKVSTRGGYQKREWPEAPCPPRTPNTRIPSMIPGWATGAETQEGREAAASCPSASGRAEREGRHTPSPAAATPGLCRRAGGQGPLLAPASLGRLPAPPRWGRQMGRPPAQQRRQETAAGAAWKAAAGHRGGARTGSAHRRGGATWPRAGTGKAM